MEWYETKKVFFTNDNLTPDVDSSLRPAYLFGAEAFEHKYYSAQCRKWQSAPSVTKAKDGVLYCCFSGDNYGGDEEPNNYNAIMKSADNGLTWQPELIIDHPDSVRLHEPIMWSAPDGTVWHFWAQSYNWWDGRAGVWAITKNVQKGETGWSAPRRLCDGVMATPPLLLSNGNIMLPVSIWKHFKSRYRQLPELELSNVYVSEDGGKTFHYVGGANEKDTTFDENAVVERADGSLYMIMRCEHAISWSVSEDGGKTWSEPRKLMDHTSARSWLAKFPSGRYLLVTNNSAEERTDMTAFLSEDECRTWTPKLLLDGKTSVSYPAGCIDENGRVYVSYDFNRYQEEEMYCASFTEAELLNGKITEPDSFLQRLICKGGGGKKTDKIFDNGEPGRLY